MCEYQEVKSVGYMVQPGKTMNIVETLSPCRKFRENGSSSQILSHKIVYVKRKYMSMVGSYSDFLGFCSGENYAFFLRILAKVEKYLLQNFIGLRKPVWFIHNLAMRVKDMILQNEEIEKPSEYQWRNIYTPNCFPVCGGPRPLSALVKTC